MLTDKQVKKLSNTEIHYAITDILSTFDNMSRDMEYFKDYLQSKLTELDMYTGEKYNRK